jgi:hypothetical protein
MFDGKNAESGIIIYYVKTQLKTKDCCKKIMLFITQLVYYFIILGLLWLKKHDPKIEFASHTFTFDSEYCRKHCNTFVRFIKIKILHDIPTKALLHNLPFRPPEFQHLNIAKCYLRPVRYTTKGIASFFTVIIKDINRYLQNASPPEPRDLLPKKLKDYADVLSPKEAEKLPPY